MSDLDQLTVGLVLDMLIEKANDNYEYEQESREATQDDFDSF